MRKLERSNFHERVFPEAKHPVYNLHLLRLQTFGHLQQFSHLKSLVKSNFQEKFVA